ncbi:MAG: PAS domain S-box protein, partial [Solirubrobacteraceae bacterium]
MTTETMDDEQRSADPAPRRTAGEAIAPLRGLLELSLLMRGRPTPLQTLQAVAGTIAATLGFETVAINAYRPETDDYEVVVVLGTERARQVLLGDVTRPSSWERFLAERFRRHGVYFIPGGSIAYDDDPTERWYRPESSRLGPWDEREWHPDDALFAALDGTGGRRYGLISVDEPSSGRRPDDDELELLGVLATHAALAIESWLQVSALEAALARNRALIDGTLDCVIAVDQAQRIVDFNPAAEQAFGRRSADAIGHSVSELLGGPDRRGWLDSIARQ